MAIDFFVSVLQYLKLTQPPKARTQWLDYILGQVEDHGEDKLRYAKQDRVLGEPDWRRVQALAELGGPHRLRRQVSLLAAEPNASHSNQALSSEDHFPPLLSPTFSAAVPDLLMTQLACKTEVMSGRLNHGAAQVCVIEEVEE